MVEIFNQSVNLISAEVLSRKHIHSKFVISTYTEQDENLNHMKLNYVKFGSYWIFSRFINQFIILKNQISNNRNWTENVWKKYDKFLEKSLHIVIIPNNLKGSHMTPSFFSPLKRKLENKYKLGNKIVRENDQLYQTSIILVFYVSQFRFTRMLSFITSAFQ